MDASTRSHTHNIGQSLELANEWDVIQSVGMNGHRETDAGQMNLARNGEPNGIPDSGSNPGNLSPLQDVDSLSLSCSCLDELHSILMSLQPFPSPSFPSLRGPLVRATNLARAVVRCPFCPRDYPSALQNLMLLNTLLPLVTHGYAELLTHIQERAGQGSRITYRVGDTSQSNAHLHTSAPDCPMGFNIELDSDEWAAMARKVVKQDVYGNAQSADSLLSVVEELEQRQQNWHLLQPFSPNASCPGQQLNDTHKRDGFCLLLTSRTRGSIDALDL